MISDVVPFLANIALVAHADGTLSAAELGQLTLLYALYRKVNTNLRQSGRSRTK
jgi:hypothetical protein